MKLRGLVTAILKRKHKLKTCYLIHVHKVKALRGVRAEGRKVTPQEAPAKTRCI